MTLINTARHSVRIAILTVSDTRTFATDTSGGWLQGDIKCAQ